jgi:hypothetical protein
MSTATSGKTNCKAKIMLIYRSRIADLILKVPTWVTFEE